MHHALIATSLQHVGPGHDDSHMHLAQLHVCSCMS